MPAINLHPELFTLRTPVMTLSATSVQARLQIDVRHGNGGIFSNLSGFAPDVRLQVFFLRGAGPHADQLLV